MPNPAAYFNRKVFYALAVQAAVGANYKFHFLSTVAPGSVHDSLAFTVTDLCNHLSSGNFPSWAAIVADEAHACTESVLTPWSGRRLPWEKDSFNYWLSSCRMTVEQAFGIFVARFVIFWKPLPFSIQKCALVVTVAAKIHNFILEDDLSASVPGLLENDRGYDGRPEIWIQDSYDLYSALHRRRRDREASIKRAFIAKKLRELSVKRPGRI
jgi:hypothetical protein